MFVYLFSYKLKGWILEVSGDHVEYYDILKAIWIVLASCTMF